MPALRPFRLGLIVLVATAYGVVLLAALGSVAPVWFIAGLLVTLVVTLNSSILLLRLSVFLDVVSRREPGQGTVALTFDDGPHPVHTRRTLDLLDAAGAKATFFVIGSKAQAHPDVVAEIVRRGHEVGLHSYSHDHLLFMRSEPSIVDDCVRTQDAIERAAGVRPKLFRPPVGFSSPRTRAAVRQLGLSVIGWSARAYDGAGRPSPEQILGRLGPSLVDGAIVLLHDAPERGDTPPTSIEALPALLSLLKGRGLRAVTVTSHLGPGVADAVAARSPS